MALENYINRHWYSRWPLWWGVPLSWLYRAINGGKKLLYTAGIKRGWSAPVPVVVVGNLTAGGTGKTPVVIALVEALAQRGMHPAVISRGYGSSAENATLVNDATSPANVGDEPFLIHQRTGCPVAVCRDRRASIMLLLEAHPLTDIIIADDGLQHLKLDRDIEIVVVDGQRQFGNGWQIPAGPLRDPMRRLQSVDFVVHNGGPNAGFNLCIDRAYNLATGESKALNEFDAAHAIAGIGNPQRFFDALTLANVPLQQSKAFPDHHPFLDSDADADWAAFANDSLPILLTEKDAVKCRTLAIRERLWSVPATAVLPPALLDKVAAVAAISGNATP